MENNNLYKVSLNNANHDFLGYKKIINVETTYEYDNSKVDKFFNLKSETLPV